MATLQDVATKAGVSRVTVSKVINNYDTVSASTRNKVLRALEELNIPVGELKRNKESSMTVGVLMPMGRTEGGRNHFSMDILAGAESKAFEKDYFMIIGNTGASRDREAKVVSRMLQREVDGLVLLSTSGEQYADHLDFLLKSQVPIVLIDQKLQQIPAHVVRGDNFAGAMLLTEHLISLGHKDIAILTLETIHSTYADRLNGYRMALMKSSITVPDSYTQILSNREASYLAAQHLLQSESKPTALFVAQPSLLPGVLKAVQSLGLRIPEQLSIVVFDDQYASLPEEYHRFFTTINQSAGLIGSMAMEILFQHLADPSLPYQEIVLPGALRINRSTGPAPSI
ncbi:LacI family DNA-binding transcriptional regulator [Paenibacillus filicis]|uniref:LacI family DNA-binding transcriptional regulator n=1 Tax=Paenibacillus gyeongsangnamensis TaxID=3388067 RepID=A0ABT4Q5Q1_9BACL|nr:LacI family DNA-binding transcriptional regulator [Paenibacillus filicis]MCZ8512192.1 LacI family DNA-binding transcriptional regulator [Paenibacillus filicis]